MIRATQSRELHSQYERARRQVPWFDRFAHSSTTADNDFGHFKCSALAAINLQTSLGVRRAICEVLATSLHNVRRIAHTPAANQEFLYGSTSILSERIVLDAPFNTSFGNNRAYDNRQSMKKRRIEQVNGPKSPKASFPYAGQRPLFRICQPVS